MKIDVEIAKENRECVGIVHITGCIILQLDNGCVAIDNKGSTFHQDMKLSFWNDTAKQKL